jgi:hypothetical protein
MATSETRSRAREAEGETRSQAGGQATGAASGETPSRPPRRLRRPSTRSTLTRAALTPAVALLTLAALTLAPATTALPAEAAVTPGASYVYVPLNPGRICDTRPTNLSGVSDACSGHTLAAGGSITVDMPAAVVPSSAVAVVLSVAVTDTAGQGYITVWPAGQTMPTSSNLDYTAGQTVSNTVTVELGTDASTKAEAVSVYNGPPDGSGASADVVVDLEGYYISPVTTTPAGEYHALVPGRLADTRCGRTPNGPGSSCSTEGIPAANKSLNFLSAGGSINVQVAGEGGVPTTGAEAAVLNLTVTNALGSGYVAAFPTGGANPATATTPFSNQQYAFANTISTKVIVPIGANGQVSIYNGPAAGTHDIDVVVDVDGYFSSASGSPGSQFVPLAPSRLLDTRVTDSPVAPGDSVPLTVGGTTNVPSTASGAVLNVTDVPTQGNYLTVYPDDQSVPVASDVNYVTSDAYAVVPNATYSKLGADGGVKIYNGPPSTSSNASGAFVVVDLFGYFTQQPETTISLTASPNPALLNTSVAVTATVKDSAGKAVVGDPVTFKVSGGACILNLIQTCSLSPASASTDSTGTAKTTLSGLGAVGSATVTATDPSGASGSVEVAVVLQL